jgi:membrane protein DedA with SNARE-associated domain
LDWAKLAAIRTLILVLAGFTGIAAGAFLIFTPAGWIVLGISLLLVAYLTDPGPGRSR